MKSALCLVSSGIDSPVTGSIMMDKLNVSFVYFDNQFSNKNNIQRKKVMKLMQRLADNSKKKLKLYIADHETIQLEFKNNSNTRFQCVFCKRTMYRVSEKLAEKEKIDFLLTGENVGQVASQTLNNLITQQKSVNMIILRPLLSFDKNDIIKIAREIGTYDLSISKDLDCPFLPDNPATKTKPHQLELQEKKLDVDKLINQAVENVLSFEFNPKH